MTPPPGCAAHAGIGEELRALAVSALDQLDPVLDRLRSEPPATSPDRSGGCAGCPICAVLAALRGERPELAARLAEHVAGLAAVLRAALDEGRAGDGSPGPSTPSSSESSSSDSAAPEPSPTSRRVQRIRVERPSP